MIFKKVMLVDDEKISNIINKKVLQYHDKELEISEYTDPVEAFGQIAEIAPDIIFLDINMPVMNGWDFLDAMEKNNISIPVIVLSSSTSDSDIRKSESFTNVKKFYSKPLRTDGISAFLESI